MYNIDYFLKKNLRMTGRMVTELKSLEQLLVLLFFAFQSLNLKIQ